MSNRIVITIEVPDGVTPNVEYVTAGSPSPAPRPAAATPPAAAGHPSASVCPDHGTPWNWKEPGTKKDGTSYDGFWKCGGKDAEGSFCKKRPPRGWTPPAPPAQPDENFDDLPF